MMSQPVNAAMDSIKQKVKPEHEDYIGNNAEACGIVTQFLESVVKDKPKSTEQHAARYFSTMDFKLDPSDCDPLLIVGPSGCGKVAWHDAGDIPREDEKRIPRRVRVLGVIHDEIAETRRGARRELFLHNQRRVQAGNIELSKENRGWRDRKSVV